MMLFILYILFMYILSYSILILCVYPYMLCTAAAFVIVTVHDDDTGTTYSQVTTLSIKYYLQYHLL